MNKNAYKTEVLSQLENTKHYIKLDNDTTPDIADNIITILNRLERNNYITSEICDL